MGKSIRFTAAALCALMLAACGADGPVSTGGDTTDPGGGADGSSVEGEYVASDVDEDGRPKDLVEGTTIQLRLEGGELTASAGCNHIGGTYVIEGGALHVDALEMTEMGCPPGLREQDEWFVDLLSSSPRVEPRDEGLLVRGERVEISFVDRSTVDPDQDLVGTAWVVDGYISGAGPDGAVSSAGGDLAELVFEAGGFVTGNDGCNSFGYAGADAQEPSHGLRYEIEGQRIAFSGAAVTTDIACPDVDTDRFWSVLSGTATWDIDGSRLTLLGDSDTGLMFRALG